MIAEDRAEYIRQRLGSQWPGLYGCDALECLIDQPELFYYESLKIPSMSKETKKLGFWRRFWGFLTKPIYLKELFRGKQN